MTAILHAPGAGSEPDEKPNRRNFRDAFTGILSPAAALSATFTAFR
jgi:hypothetical protein